MQVYAVLDFELTSDTVTRWCNIVRSYEIKNRLLILRISEGYTNFVAFSMCVFEIRLNLLPSIMNSVAVSISPR